MNLLRFASLVVITFVDAADTYQVSELSDSYTLPDNSSNYEVRSYESDETRFIFEDEETYFGDFEHPGDFVVIKNENGEGYSGKVTAKFDKEPVMLYEVALDGVIRLKSFSNVDGETRFDIDAGSALMPVFDPNESISTGKASRSTKSTKTIEVISADINRLSFNISMANDPSSREQYRVRVELTKASDSDKEPSLISDELCTFGHNSEYALFVNTQGEGVCKIIIYDSVATNLIKYEKDFYYLNQIDTAQKEVYDYLAILYAPIFASNENEEYYPASLEYLFNIDHTDSVLPEGNISISDPFGGSKMTYEQAYDYIRYNGAVECCDNLTVGAYEHWRLSNINELESIIDHGTGDSSVYSTFQNHSASSNYWSSTTESYNASSALYVDLNGGKWGSSKMNNCKVRCVH